MAIAHFRSKIIGQGVSPIAAAAYRHRTSLHDDAVGLTFSYGADADLVHAELTLPNETPQWFRVLVDGRTPAKASEALWNSVIAAEKRADAQYAREIVIALPLELTREQNIALVQDYIATDLTARGFVVDWVFHDKPGNPHIHLMHTLRPLEQTGFGPKRIALTDDNGVVHRDAMGVIKYRHFAGTRADFVDMRRTWGEAATRHLAAAGHEIVVDMRSFADRGIDVTPTTHLGAAVSGSRRDGRNCFADHLLDDRAAARVHAIVADPAVVLDLVTTERSTFGDADIARVLHRYVDDVEIFDRLMVAVKALPELVTLRPVIADPDTGTEVAKAVYSTRAMVRLEHEMSAAVERLAAASGFAAGVARVEAAIRAVEERDTGRLFRFADEQRGAVHHVTGSAAIAAIVGRAGAGKSTLLNAARIAWTEQGNRVLGAALAGKAAEGLQASSGIPSRTIASWEYAWKQGRDLLRRGDVLVLDEAGMVSSKQMAMLVETVEKAGAKLVLVGDPEQLQPIEAGAAFRAIVERIGFAELSDVRRQHEPWMRQATQQLARGEVGAAVAAYQKHNAVQTLETKSQAIELLVHDWAKARFDGDDKSALALAHTNADVLAINAAIRTVMTESGALSAPIAFETARGERQFAVGDRVLFLENKRVPAAGAGNLIAVKNGSLGTVASTNEGALTVAMDSGPEVRFNADVCRHVDHGYAATIHKSQGATVDRAFVLVSPGMDRHLAYVAFSRHRETLKVYVPQEAFGRRSLGETLSRSGAKSTTLDFSDGATGAAIVRRRGGDALADWLDVFRHRVEQLRARLAAIGGKLRQLQPAHPSQEIAAVEQQVAVNSKPTAAVSIRATMTSKFASVLTRLARRGAGPREDVQLGADRRGAAERSSDLKPHRASERQEFAASTAMANTTTEHALNSHNASQTRASAHAAAPDTSTAKESNPNGTRQMQTTIKHSTLHIEGNTARVAFTYDKTANESFLKTLGSNKAEFNAGAWQIKLPTETEQRDVALGKVELAQRAIEPRLKDLAVSQGFSERIAAAHPKSEEVDVSVRNNALAVKIPPAQAAIDEIKALGGKWIPKNEKSQAGGYWRIQVKDEVHANVVTSKLSVVDQHVASEARSTSLAKSIQSPHDEITLSRAGNTLFVTTANMREANSILKAEGPGAMKWDSSADAYAVKVEAGDGTAEKPGNITDINRRLASVSEFYQTKCLLPPQQGMPGLAPPTDNERTMLEKADARSYAEDASVRKIVDAVQARLSKALSEQDRMALQAHKPGEAIASERLSAIPQKNLDAVAALAQNVQAVQSKGVAQQLEQARSQSKSQAVTIGG